MASCLRLPPEHARGARGVGPAASCRPLMDFTAPSMGGLTGVLTARGQHGEGGGRTRPRASSRTPAFLLRGLPETGAASSQGVADRGQASAGRAPARRARKAAGSEPGASARGGASRASRRAARRRLPAVGGAGVGGCRKRAEPALPAPPALPGASSLALEFSR